MSKYYCLIAGLPDITIDDNKLSYTVKEFRAELSETLSNNDKKLIDLFYLQFDHKNLLAMLTKQEGKFDNRGLYTSEQLEEIIALVKENETPSDKKYPSYFYVFIAAYLQDKPLIDNMSWEDQLNSLYYEYAGNSSNRFVSDWFKLNLNLNNMLTAIICRKYNREVGNAIIGKSEISETIRQSGQRDMGLTGMVDYLDTILRISEENNLYERERKLDQFRWNWLDEYSFFHYFTIERIFAYLIKLDILERWVSMTPENGRAIFKEMIDSLKKGIEIPSDF